MSLNEIKKEFHPNQIAGKGHNVIFKMAIPMQQLFL